MQHQLRRWLWPLLALLPIEGFAAAPAVDNGIAYDGASATTHNMSAFTVAASATIVLGIRVQTATDTITSVTSSPSCTSGWALLSFDQTGTAGAGLGTWICLSHPGGSTAITINLSGAAVLRAVAESYTGAGSYEALVHALEGNSVTHTSGNIVTTGTDRRLVGIFAASGDATSIAPNSGETERLETGTQRLQLEDITKATAGTYTVSWVLGTSKDGALSALALYTATAPTYTADPAFGTRTTSSTSATATLTTTGTTTRYAVLVPDGESAPSCTQIKAGQKQSGAAAPFSGNVSVTTTVQNTITMTSMTSGAKYDWFECTNNSGGDSTVKSLADQFKSPVLTSATLNARTTSSITLRCNADATGTCYCIAGADGAGTPTAAQIVAGNQNGGSAAYKSGNVTVSAEATNYDIALSSYTDGTIRDGYCVLRNHSSVDSAVVAIADMYKTPAFSAGPTFSSCTATGCTYSLTLDGAGTVYGVACKADLTAATVTQVEAAQCTGGGAATASANKSVTGADTLTIGSALDYPIHDFAIVGTYGSQHEAAIHADNARLKSAASGYLYDTLTSVSATSWCNGISSPAAAATDVVELTNPTAILAKTVTVDGSCDWTFDNTGARDRICARVYDRSVKDWMTITSPSAYCSGTRAAIWFNNQQPTPPPPNTVKYYVPLNSAMTPIDLSTICTDPEGDAITVTNVDALPTGLSITTNSLSGTATVRGKTKNIRFSCTDITGASVTWQ